MNTIFDLYKQMIVNNDYNVLCSVMAILVSIITLEARYKHTISNLM